MRLALFCARARVGDYWGKGFAQRVVNMTERMTCCCGVLRSCLPAPLNFMGSSQEAPSGSPGGALLEAAGRQGTNAPYISALQWRACATMGSCSEKDCKPEDCGKASGSCFKHGICSMPLMSLNDTMEVSGSLYNSAKVVWRMHAGQANRLK